MKRLTLFILILLSACKSDRPDIPADVMPPEKMIAIMQDMHIVDAVAENKGQMGMDEKMLAEEYHEQLFKNHGTTRTEFLKSFAFYEDNPKLLDELYNTVLQDLSKREAAVSKDK